MNLGQEYLLLVVRGMLRGVAVGRCLRRTEEACSSPATGDFPPWLAYCSVGGALAWFFWEGGRNLPDTGGGIAGAAQFYLFMLGGFLALLVTFLFTSLTNISKKTSVDTADGLPALRETTYLHALTRNLSTVWKLYHRLTRKFSSG